MSEVLFPIRQRCRKCRKFLGYGKEEVLLGQFCSAKCAGMAPPTPSAGHPVTPRECKTQRDGDWVFKRRYRSAGEIPERIRDDPSTSTYWCGHCGHLHVGRTLVQMPRAQNRGLRSRRDIADLLTKARGKATGRQVGQAAGVRPVRIKEWEDPDFDNPSLGVLFSLLSAYRLDLAVVFGPVSKLGAV